MKAIPTNMSQKPYLLVTFRLLVSLPVSRHNIRISEKLKLGTGKLLCHNSFHYRIVGLPSERNYRHLCFQLDLTRSRKYLTERKEKGHVFSCYINEFLMKIPEWILYRKLLFFSLQICITGCKKMDGIPFEIFLTMKFFITTTTNLHKKW